MYNVLLYNVLLVKIQPSDLPLPNANAKDFEFFPNNNEQRKFKISVSQGEPLEFSVSKVYYRGSTVFSERADAISADLGVKHGGHVIAIDKYPSSQFLHGAKVDNMQRSEYVRYEIECHSDLTYDIVILLPPCLKPIILSSLNFAFACYDPRGYSPSSIVFNQEAVLSLKSLFGKVEGIALKQYNESALKPDANGLYYTMSFEAVSLPEIVLQKLLVCVH